MGDLQSPATEVMSTVNKFPLHSLNRQFVWELLLQLFLAITSGNKSHKN